ncbi:site-2 protease family protein [Streptomyces sp. NPDC003710]
MTTSTPPSIHSTSHLVLHTLAARPEDNEWIIGRMESGTFVAVSEAAHDAIQLLANGMTPARAQAALRDVYGQDLDLLGFAQMLAELGLVAAVDGTAVYNPLPRPTFAWITPRRARWSLSPLIPLILALLLVGAAAAVAHTPALWPTYRDLFWSHYSSLNIAAMFGIGWSILLVHELGHLLVARATGVPARMSLGTRLHFLVAQTDISGIELASRRHRLTAYLAGVAVNLAVAAVSLLAAAATPVGTPTTHLLSAITVMALIPIPFQFMVFMRTDIYFVLQDLTGCRDLYGDGRAYVRYRVRRLLAALWPGATTVPDPSSSLSAREQRAVRWYAFVQVTGTALCLAVLAAVTLPTDMTLLTHAAHRAMGGDTLVDILDGVVVLISVAGVHVLWACTKWRTYRATRTARSQP